MDLLRTSTDWSMQNQLPSKDIVKVSFVLEPFQNSLPAISADGYVTQPKIIRLRY